MEGKDRIKGISKEEQLKLEGDLEAKLATGISEGKYKKESWTEVGHDSGDIKEAYPMNEWVYENIPFEFRRNKDIINIFHKISREDAFFTTWNYKISLPKGLTEKDLIGRSSFQMENLELLSHTDLNFNPQDLDPSKNIGAEIEKITRTINALRDRNKSPTQRIYDTAISTFTLKVSFYLRARIIVEKLKEMKVILQNYELPLK